MLLLTSYILYCFFFFFKQKTAYEMRISDWSSDVCSSDLSVDPALLRPEPRLLVTIVRIDKALVEELGRVALLPDLSFGQGDDHRSGEYAILDDHGRPLADLRWRAKQPGNLLLHKVVPAVSVGLLAAALAMAIDRTRP